MIIMKVSRRENGVVRLLLRADCDVQVHRDDPAPASRSSTQLLTYLFIALYHH